MSLDSTVGIAIGYEVDGRRVGVRVPVDAKFLSSIRGQGVKLTTHFQLVPRSRIYEFIHPLHGTVLN
jgi:hypothetical protein